MAGKAVDAIDAAFGALKLDGPDHTLWPDHITRLKAVERYSDVLALAQGKVVEKPVDEGGLQVPWEEFELIYSRRPVETPTSQHVPHPHGE
jgi:hypothetical protein